MYVLSSPDDPRAVRWDDPRAGYQTTSVYLLVCTCFYAMVATSPFWATDSVETSATTTTTTGLLAVDAAGNGTMAVGRVPSFFETWRFSWEYMGLVARCATMMLLLAGCVVCLLRMWCRLRWFPSPAFPALLGVIAGILGVYGELVLWMGTELLEPNAVLRPSQIYCTLASSFCFLSGLVVYKVTLPCSFADEEQSGRAEESTRGSSERSVGSHDAANVPGRRPSGCAPAVTVDNDSGVGMNVAVPPPSGEVCGSGLSSEEDSQQSPENFLTPIICVGTSLPLLGNVEGLLDDRSETDDLTADASNRMDRYCHQTRNPPEGTIGNYGDQADNGDFDDRVQYIDDDLFYNSSDDDELETFIHHAHDEESGQGHVSAESKTPTSWSNTSRLIMSERAFCESEDNLSRSGDDKNRTWP